MKENKYFRLLKTLSNKELKEYGKFLKSPIFNESACYVVFYEYLKQFSFDYTHSGITKENIFKIFYPHESYSDEKMRDRLTHSLTLLKEFIALNNFRQNDLDFRKHMLVGIKPRNVQKVFEEEHKKAITLLEKKSIKDEDYYRQKYILSYLFRSQFEPKASGEGKLQIYKRNSEDIDDIINFFLIVMMKEYSRMFNSEREIKIDYKFKFYEEIISFIAREQENFKDVPLIMLLFKFIQLYNLEKNEAYVSQLNTLLVANKNNLNQEIYSVFGIELYNYCKRMQSNGHKEFGSISFDLIKQFLPDGIFFEEDGCLTAHTYINIVATAIRENAMDWVETFINDYKEKVQEIERENAFNYNYSVFLYMKGYKESMPKKIVLYNSALDKLSLVTTDDFYYMTRIKNHELKIYYEMNYVENTISLIDSYCHYLKRSKLIPVYLRERYLNFVRCVEKLLKLKMGHGSMDKNQFAGYVKNKENTEYKGWILERIEELQN